MRLKSNARKANQAGRAIRNPRHPATTPISLGEDCGNRKRGDRMSRRETSPAAECYAMRFEPSVGEVPGGRDVRRAKPAVNGLHDRGEDFRVGHSLAHKEGRLPPVGILSRESEGVKGERKDRGAERRVPATRHLIEISKACCAPEVWRVVRIERHESRRYEDEPERRLQMLTARRAQRKQPNRLLVAQNIRTETSPGNRAVG